MDSSVIFTNGLLFEVVGEGVAFSDVLIKPQSSVGTMNLCVSCMTLISASALPPGIELHFLSFQ